MSPYSIPKYLSKILAISSLIIFGYVMWKDYPVSLMDLGLFAWIWAVELRGDYNNGIKKDS